MNDDKPGRVMLVTGGSRGIGAAVARAAGRRGWRVGVNYLSREDAAQAVVADVRRAGGDAVALRADVGRPAEVERLYGELDAAFGRIDALVNNAGVLASFRVAETDEERLEAMFRANVYSMFYCAREAVRRMSTAHGGQGGGIVNLSSVAARLGGLGGVAAYAATKGAIDSFTVALAKEVAREGIRVNALRPGLIDTDIQDAQGGIEHINRVAEAVVPLGRTGTADEVAEAVMWLLSDAASYVHGAILDVSGGR